METSLALKALGALAQETRLAIFRRLVQAGPGGVAAGAIAEALEVPAPTLSFHLAQLANAGLLRSRQAGRFVFYSADFDAMNALVGFLTENCCGGNACGPEALACDPAGSRKGARR
ncbi:MAG: metalloregulator ArsR/SmtB family transcription factor [Burkholderiales bacterium]|nr:metalloregulator ArsR/SmtB family transcription factor [Burkholderiales bacterium]